MYKQYLESLHILDEMFRHELSIEDIHILIPYINRWSEKLSSTDVQYTGIEKILGVSNKELDLPLNLPNAPANSITEIDVSDVL